MTVISYGPMGVERGKEKWRGGREGVRGQNSKRESRRESVMSEE